MQMSNNVALTAVAVFAWLFTAFTIVFITFYYVEAYRDRQPLTDAGERRAAMKRNRRK